MNWRKYAHKKLFWLDCIFVCFILTEITRCRIWSPKTSPREYGFKKIVNFWSSILIMMCSSYCITLYGGLWILLYEIWFLVYTLMYAYLAFYALVQSDCDQFDSFCITCWSSFLASQRHCSSGTWCAFLKKFFRFCIKQKHKSPNFNTDETWFYKKKITGDVSLWGKISSAALWSLFRVWSYFVLILVKNMMIFHFLQHIFQLISSSNLIY